MHGLHAKKVERLRYLVALYKLVDGSPRRHAPHHQVVLEAGLSLTSGADAFHYLLNEGLITLPYRDNRVSITHRGVKECEAALCTADNKRGGLFGHITTVVQINSQVTEAQISLVGCKQTVTPIGEDKGSRPHGAPRVSTGSHTDEPVVPQSVARADSRTDLVKEQPEGSFLHKLKDTATSAALDKGIRLLLQRLKGS